MRVQDRFGGLRILKILMAGYQMKFSLLDGHLFLFVGGMWDILNLNAGYGMTVQNDNDQS